MGSLSLGPDRDRVLDHAAHIVSRTWAEFDVARDTQPETSKELALLLTEGLPQDPSDPIAALDIAAEALDSSLTQARPRYLAYIGSSGLEIGALGDLLVDLVVRPPLLDGGLLRHAVGAHLKVRLWQEHGVPVDVVLLLALALLAALAALRGDDAE